MVDEGFDILLAGAGPEPPATTEGGKMEKPYSDERGTPMEVEASPSLGKSLGLD